MIPFFSQLLFTINRGGEHYLHKQNHFRYTCTCRPSAKKMQMNKHL